MKWLKKTDEDGIVAIVGMVVALVIFVLFIIKCF